MVLRGVGRLGGGFTATRRSASSDRRVSTAVLLLHQGEPSTVDEAHDFILRRSQLFHQLLPNRVLGWSNNVWRSLGGERYVEGRLDKRATASLYDLHRRQGEALVGNMGTITPEFKPVHAYVAHHLASKPEHTIEAALEKIHTDAPERVVVLPMSAQYWCFETGFALNALAAALRSRSSRSELGYRAYERAASEPPQQLGAQALADFDPLSRPKAVAVRQMHTRHPDPFRRSPPIHWSLIDRWPAHPAVADGWAKLIQDDLETRFPPDVRKATAILFCAPNYRWYGADRYRQEVAASALRIAENLPEPHAHRLAWFSSWKQFRANSAGLSSVRCQLVDLVWQGFRNILIVPLTLTASCIDSEVTLPNLVDERILKRLGAHTVKVLRPPDDAAAFSLGLGELVKNHALRGCPAPAQLGLRCETCISPHCTDTHDLFANTPNHQPN